MRSSRALAAATAAALLSVPLAGGASAADATASGAGTGTVTASVLEVAVGGDLLVVRVLGSDTTSTIDGSPSASSTLVPLTVSSSAAPALSASLPVLTTSSTGAEDSKGDERTISGVPGFGGTLTAALSSVVDAAGARSGTDAGARNLSLAGGLVTLPQGTLDIATDAAGARTLSTHALTIPSVEVLDLSALLDGLGLSLGDLSVDSLLDLVDSLGLDLNGVPEPRAVLEDLNAAIVVLEGEVGTVTADLCDAVDDALGGTLGTVGGTVDEVTDTVDDVVDGVVDDVDDVVDDVLGGGGGGGGLLGAALLEDGISCDDLVGLQVSDVLQDVEDTLGGLIDGILEVLDGTSLLSVSDVAIGLGSTATDKVETSVADVTASIGSVKVGALDVPGVSGLDLTAPAAVVNEAAEAIQAQLDGVLGALNASLAGLVDVDLLAIEELVGSKADGAVEAVSRVTALRATITPPAGLLSAAAVDLEGTVADALGAVDAALPVLDPLMGQLEGALGGLDLLTQPTVLTVGSVAATSAFRPVAAQVAAPGGGSSTPGGTLPRTGTDAALPAMAAVGLAGAALAIRRLLRHATV